MVAMESEPHCARHPKSQDSVAASLSRLVLSRTAVCNPSTFSLYPCLAAEGRGLLVDSPLYPWVRRLNGVDSTSVLRDRFVPADWCARRDADASTRR